MIGQNIKTIRPKPVSLRYYLMILSFMAFVFVFAKPGFSQSARAEVGIANNKPRVLFMIAEKNIEDTHFRYWWSWWRGVRSEHKAEVSSISTAQTVLKRAFIKKGFYVVDPGAVKGDVKIKDAYRVEDLTVRGVTVFGRVTGADIVIKGQAIAREGIKNPESNLTVYMADVTAQAVSVKGARVMASGRGHGVSRHISPSSGAIDALEEAAGELADELIVQIGIPEK